MSFLKSVCGKKQKFSQKDIVIFSLYCRVFALYKKIFQEKTKKVLTNWLAYANIGYVKDIKIS